MRAVIASAAEQSSCATDCRRCAPAARRLHPDPPARALGHMAPPRHRPPHLVRAQLDRQPVDQLGDLAARRAAPRPGCPAPRPAARTSSPRARRRRTRSRGRARRSCRPAGAADAWPRGSAARSPPPPSPPRHRRDSRTAPAAARPAAAPPAARPISGTSRSSAWRAALGIGDRLGQADRGARRRLARRRGQRFGLAPEHAVERVERIVGLAKAPRQAPPRHPGELADGLQAQAIRASASAPAEAAARRRARGRAGRPAPRPSRQRASAADTAPAPTPRPRSRPSRRGRSAPARQTAPRYRAPAPPRRRTDAPRR